MALKRAKSIDVYFQAKVSIHGEELQPFKLKTMHYRTRDTMNLKIQIHPPILNALCTNLILCVYIYESS